MEAENSEVDENVPTAEEATEATEGNAGSTEDAVDISQPGVYTEHVFTDPLGVQIPEDLSPVFQSRYASQISNFGEFYSLLFIFFGDFFPFISIYVCLLFYVLVVCCCCSFCFDLIFEIGFLCVVLAVLELCRPDVP